MKSRSIVKNFACICLLFVASGFLLQVGGKNLKQSVQTRAGAQLYMASCEPCHLTGGNMIDSNKQIVKSNKLASEKIFKQFLSQQHAQMPPWKTIVKNDAELKALFDYVKKLK
jgi:mono/diheme cytochrome c family protein